MIRALRIFCLAALLALPALAQTAATRADLYTEIDTLFADTGSDPITPAQLRQSLENITASSTNLLTDTTLTTLDGFTISSAGSIALTAGGTNESITLTPSGAGGVSLVGNNGVAGGGVNDTIALTIGSPAVASGTNSYGIYGASTVPSGATGTFSQFYSNPRTAAGLASTLISQYRATSVTLGSGSTIATLEGFSATNVLTQGSVNYGFRGSIPASGTARWNIYMDGTAPNYVAGEFLIGSSTDLGAYPLQVTGASIFTGAVTLNSTVNKLTLTAPATGSTLTIADGKTLTASNTVTFTATDGSTLAIGTGGTLGTAAYTASSAYATSAQGTKADNVGAVNGIVKSNGSATFSAASAGTDYVVPAGNVATATALATPRAIYGNNFDGSAALTQVIASTYGGTGNGFAKLSGPTTSEKTFTLPDATATILTDNAAVTVAQGGTGAATLTANNVILGNGTSAVQFVAPGTSANVLTSNGTTWASSAIPTLNQNTTGSAATLTTPRTIGNVSFDGSANIVPETIAVIDSTDSTSFPLMVDSATGSLQPKTDGGLTYNASTGALNATALSGTSLTTGNLNIIGASTGYSNTAAAPVYIVPVATADSGAAQAINATPELVAVANSDQLYGTTIASKLTSAGFTGLTTVNLFVSGQTLGGGGSIDTAYQLYMGAGPTATTRYGIYQSGSSDKNYFAGTVQTGGTVELGHATDTTLARVSAGLISVEGVNIATQTYADTAAKASRLGSHASPDTTAGSITWASAAVYEVWTNTTTTYTLPAASGYDGKAVIFYVTGTNAITIDPNSSEVIVRDGTAQTGGVTLTLTGAAGNYVCLVCDGTRWVTLGYKGTLAAGS